MSTARAHVLRLVAKPKEKRPYSAGFIIDGHPHAKKCDCLGCAKLRASELKHHLKEPAYPEVPKHLDQTVFVRPHFRRQANHYNKLPNSKAALRSLIRQMLKGAKL